MVGPEQAAAAVKGDDVELSGFFVDARVEQVATVIERGTQRFEGVVAEDALAPMVGVLVQDASARIFAQRAQIRGEIAGQSEGDGVVLAQHASAPSEGFLVESTSAVVITQPAHAETQAQGSGQGPRIVGAQLTPIELVRAVVERERDAGFAPGLKVGPGGFQEPGDLVEDGL
jgi:hypothetical protein